MPAPDLGMTGGCGRAGSLYDGGGNEVVIDGGVVATANEEDEEEDDAVKEGLGGNG